MIRKVRLALPILASLVVLVLGANAAMAAVWSSSAQYASWSNGGYTLYNDVWASAARDHLGQLLQQLGRHLGPAEHQRRQVLPQREQEHRRAAELAEQRDQQLQ